jgi:hypothetical protein
VTVGPGIELMEIGTEELGVLMSAGHDLTATSDVNVTELAGRELIWFPRELAPGFYDATIDRLRALGGEVVISDSTAGAAQWRSALLLNPEAISLSSARAVAPDLAWRPLCGRSLQAAYAAAWRADNRNAELHGLLRLMRQGLTSVR